MGCGCHHDHFPFVPPRHPHEPPTVLNVGVPRHYEYPHQPPHHNHHGCCPTGPLHQHHNQSPTFLSRDAVPCKPPPFIPNQPPVHHHHGCCEVPPPPQKGPYEYTPSHLYPDPHHVLGCCCDDHHPFVPNQPVIHHTHPQKYYCMPKQGPIPNQCPCNPKHPPLHHEPMHAPPGDPNHPAHYPGLITPIERPEPHIGMPKIRFSAETTDHQMTAVQYTDGRYEMIPNGYVVGGHVTHNGPAVIPWDDIRGNISDSEGMDCLNYAFNNTDNGASF